MARNPQIQIAHFRTRKPPCAGCTERVVGCHSKCEGYNAWKEECEAIKQTNADERRLDAYIAKRLHQINVAEIVKEQKRNLK